MSASENPYHHYEIEDCREAMTMLEQQKAELPQAEYDLGVWFIAKAALRVAKKNQRWGNPEFMAQVAGQEYVNTARSRYRILPFDEYVWTWCGDEPCDEDCQCNMDGCHALVAALDAYARRIVPRINGKPVEQGLPPLSNDEIYWRERNRIGDEYSARNDGTLQAKMEHLGTLQTAELDGLKALYPTICQGPSTKEHTLHPICQDTDWWNYERHFYWRRGPEFVRLATDVFARRDVVKREIEAKDEALQWYRAELLALDLAQVLGNLRPGIIQVVSDDGVRKLDAP